MKTTIETLKGFYFECKKEDAIISYNGFFFNKDKENAISNFTILVLKGKAQRMFMTGVRITMKFDVCMSEISIVEKETIITETQLENIISDSNLTTTEKNSIDVIKTENGFFLKPSGKYENASGKFINVSKKSYFKIQDFLCKLNLDVALKTKNLTISII
jgi:hypothetical protein